jgi:hypothetical protein
MSLKTQPAKQYSSHINQSKLNHEIPKTYNRNPQKLWLPKTQLITKHHYITTKSQFEVQQNCLEKK